MLLHSFRKDGVDEYQMYNYITENCGILEHLLPGDVIPADRGFNIHDSAGMFCAEVHLPSFTKGKKQLSMQGTS